LVNHCTTGDDSYNPSGSNCESLTQDHSEEITLVQAINNGDAVRTTDQHNAYDVTVRGLAPLTDWSAMGESEHFVQFYETDTFLLDSLSGFIGMGLGQNDACIVVATKAHREGLDERLQAYGMDVAKARACGQYVSLDAEETLSKFMLNGEPVPALFAQVVAGIIESAVEGRQRVRIFGEMVALLWEEENYDGALRLEGLWNDLHQTRSFQLFCAYPMKGFGGEALAGPFGGVCEGHTRVIPAESYTGLNDTEMRLRAITQLQQKARSLEAVKDQLEVQVEDLRRLHEMSVRLTSTLDIESVLEEVLRAAMAVQGTDLGLLSLCTPKGDSLQVKASSGFDAEFLKQIEFVPIGEGACGKCYEQRERVVVEDVLIDAIFAPYREAAKAAGLRACHSTPLITRSGQIIGVLSVHFRQPHRPSERETRLMDLYARMAADSIENARLYRQSLEANRVKDEFLATVSHELRTPLTSIVGWTHMLRSGQLDEQASANALVTIERNARSQTQIVEDLLDVSRIVNGKLRLDVCPLDPASPVEAAIEAVSPAAEARGLRIEKVIDTGVGAVAGDAARLQQVFWNLLSNAIKFTPVGGRVRVSLERVNSHIEIKVSDTGMGIKAEFLPHVFDRFRQEDMSTTRLHGGLGLGLAIVHHLVELHGGTVRAESHGEGQGSTFTVSLPLDSVSTKESNQESAEPLAGVEADLRLECLDRLDGVTVLVVEDEPDTRELLQVMLGQCGASVTSVESAREALLMLEQLKPDVLVSDIGMPHEDGYELIKKVRALPKERGGRVPAIALTAYARTEDRLRVLKAGYQMHVPKPVEFNELVTIVNSLVERSEKN
jgi:signal transduction histidine kinase/ActR/RegA family two-component response regulator